MPGAGAARRRVGRGRPRRDRPEGWCPNAVLADLAAGKAPTTIAKEWAERWGHPRGYVTLRREIQKWSIHNETVAMAHATGAPAATSSADPSDWEDRFLGAYRATVEESEVRRPDLGEALRRSGVTAADFWRAFRQESGWFSPKLRDGAQQIEDQAQVERQRLHDELGGTMFVVQHDAVNQIDDPAQRAGRANELMRALGPSVFLPPTQHQLRVSGQVAFNVGGEARLQLIRPNPGQTARIESVSRQLFMPRTTVEVAEAGAKEEVVEAVYEELAP